jgi:hypothetical protein
LISFGGLVAGWSLFCRGTRWDANRQHDIKLPIFTEIQNELRFQKPLAHAMFDGPSGLLEIHGLTLISSPTVMVAQILQGQAILNQNSHAVISALNGLLVKGKLFKRYSQPKGGLFTSCPQRLDTLTGASAATHDVART